MLAVRWLFPGTEINIETRCLDLGEPIRIRMRDEEILKSIHQRPVRTHEYSVRQGFNRRGALGLGLKPHESLPVGRTCEELVVL